MQIKRIEPTTTHLVSEPAACPYCVQDNFGVVYTPPTWRSGIGCDAAVSRLNLFLTCFSLISRFRASRLLFDRHLPGLILQKRPSHLSLIPLINDVKEALVPIVQKL